ncbi:MAG: hypothetical protein PHO85_01430, partial [Candidatus Cloacimonetes bacterium]|nr:hypothetical protein [Candidatus Cloacimonadota bacterium]
MKKIITPFFVLLLPVIIFAGVFDSPFTYNNVMPVSRAWRWSQQIESYAEGSEWIPEMRVRPFYNSNNTAQIDSMHMDSWEESIGDWIPNVMVSYISYNNAGRITQNEIRMNVQGMLFPILKLT